MVIVVMKTYWPLCNNCVIIPSGTNVQTSTQDIAYGPAYPLCFHPSFYCDGWIDCPDDATHDEMNCPLGSVSDM